jgi:hypothetical protein
MQLNLVILTTFERQTKNNSASQQFLKPIRIPKENMNQTISARSPNANRNDEDISVLPLMRFFQSPLAPVAADSTNGMQRKAKFHVLHVRRSMLR